MIFSFQGGGNNTFGVHRCQTDGKQLRMITISWTLTLKRAAQVEEKYHRANPGATLYWDNLQQGVGDEL